MSFFQLLSGESVYFERIDGSKEKPCLVFLHEGLGCTAMWKSFPSQLCEQTGCSGLVYDRIGYGQSDALTSARDVHYLHRYALTELEAVLQGLLADQDCILIGHSDGGSISLIHAATQAPRLKAIITEAAHVFVEKETLAGIREATDAFADNKLGALEKYHGDKMQATFKAWSDTWLSYGFQFWNIEALLPSITCDSLVIQGVDDHYGSEKQVQSIIKGTVGNARALMVPDCAHSPHSEQGEVVLREMVGFIKGVL